MSSGRKAGQQPKELAEQAKSFHAWLACGRNNVHAAQMRGTSEKTIRRDVAAVMRHLNMEPLPSAEPTLDDHVRVHQARESESASKAQLRDAYKRISDLQERCNALEWAAGASLEPAKWTLPTHKNKPREHISVLLTSDFQVGEVIDANETEAGYGYSTEIFRERYRQMIDTAIYLSTQHSGAGWIYPGFIYARGGDTIDGALRPESIETGDRTPNEQVEVAYEEEAAGIAKLADAFGKVEVKSFGAGGNHDRDTFKPYAAAAVKHSWDRLVQLLLRREFHRDPRVTFQTSETFDVRFPIYGQTALLTHGDRMGSRGGQGMVGPAATILRGVQKLLLEQAALGFHVDIVMHGHFHYPMQLPFLHSNGCMPGYNPYAKTNRMRPTPPQQLLTYHHQRGVVDYKPIILAGDTP